jgi:hypothetical protein
MNRKPTKTRRRRRSGLRERVLAFFGCQTRGEAQALRLLAIYQRLYHRGRESIGHFAARGAAGLDAFRLGPGGRSVLVPATAFQKLLDEQYGVDHPTVAEFRRRVDAAREVADVLGGNGPA